MVWISKKELNRRLTELEEKVNRLDPEKISEECQKLSEGWLTNTANKIVDGKIKDFSNRFHAIQNRLAEQDKKIEEFISSTQKITQKVISRISGLLKEISALIGEKPEETKGAN